MKSTHSKPTIGLLMVVIANLAVIFATPWSTWVALGSQVRMFAPMVVIVMAGFGVAVLASKVATGVGIKIGAAPAIRRGSDSIPGKPPCPRT